MKPFAFVDLDGTVMDSMLRQYRVFQAACETYGYKTNVTYSGFASKKREGYSTKSILEECGVKDACVSAYWREHIEDSCWLKLDCLYGDAKKFLQEISNLYHVVILTARRNPYVKEVLQSMDISRYISAIKLVAPEDPYEGKRCYIAKAPYENGIIVGDTEVEYQLGKEFGIDTFLLNRGFRSEAFWERKGIISYAGLLRVLEDIRNPERAFYESICT